MENSPAPRRRNIRPACIQYTPKTRKKEARRPGRGPPEGSPRPAGIPALFRQVGHILLVGLGVITHIFFRALTLHFLQIGIEFIQRTRAGDELGAVFRHGGGHIGTDSNSTIRSEVSSSKKNFMVLISVRR